LMKGSVPTSSSGLASTSQTSFQSHFPFAN